MMDFNNQHEREKVIAEFLQHRSWHQVGILGKSSFGTVLSVKTEDSKNPVAVKFSEVQNQLEYKVWPKLLHPNVIALYDIIKTSSANVKAFVMPQCATTLAHHLQGSSLTRQSDALTLITKWLYQILCGLKYLHDKELSHLDLKLDNVLLTSKNSAVLSDFNHISDAKLVTTEYFMGMPNYWKPPELWNCSSYVQHVPQMLDVWCYGLIVLESVTRFSLLRHTRTAAFPLTFQVVSSFVGSVLEGNTLESYMKKAYPSVEAIQSFQKFRDFMELFLRTSPSERVSVQKGVCHRVLFPYNSALKIIEKTK